ncbi:MAG TPA: bifunctional acetate--CoA ligase family protein/GNAT family N-acetyltransferase [Rhizomicrobium sp.]|jgi:acetyltransferase
MSIRNLDAIFRPKSIALIGASARPRSIGALVAHNLMAGGFNGPIMLVNPHSQTVEGAQVYPDIASLPSPPDLGVIATPPETVPGLIAELAERGARGAIVITAGFREAGTDQGRALECEMLEAARPHLLRIVGPNCVGVMSTPAGVNASFAQVAPRKGDVAFVAQSGAMVTTVLDWATARGIGFSHLVSLGDMADVDFGDLLDYLTADPQTRAVLLYVESVTEARKFMSAARAAARLKPVIAIKAGRQAAGAKAAASHTGALAGLDGVYDAAFRRAGILRVFSLDEVFDAVETLAMHPPVKSDALIILTNGGGVGVLATDALLEQGGRLAELAPETLAALDKVLPHTWSHGNPVDIIGDADGARYAAALGCICAAPGDDAVLVLNCPTAVASGVEAARAVVKVARDSGRAILTNWLGASAAEESRRIFADAGIPTYETPESAVRGFMHLVRRRRGQQTLMEVPPSIPTDFAPDAAQALRVVRAARDEGDTWLSAQHVTEMLGCYGIAMPRTGFAATPDEAAALAAEFAMPVVLKIASPDILHKSDVGGVRIDLSGEAAVRSAAQEMLQRVKSARPAARLTGFTVQEMIRMPEAFELILGMAIDKTFGPFLLFGQGGTAVEVIDDTALALPPLNLALARELMSQTRVWKQLQGYRDRPPAALDAVALTLVQLSQLVCDIDDIAELDINPLLADAHGVVALDARIRLLPTAEVRRDRLAIRPYPKELERRESVEGIGEVLLRPVTPEDAPAFIGLFKRLQPEDIRLRFFGALRNVPANLLARLTQIDYDREMAFALFQGNEVLGVVRLAADPDNARAEFAVLVRSDLKAHGLGRYLMHRLIAYARTRGTGELFGEVLAENTLMLNLCKELGFRTAPSSGTPGILRVELALQRGADA